MTIRSGLLAEQLEAERARRNHLEEMGLAAAGLAHELNQFHAAILNYIDACSERIRSGRGDPAEMLRIRL
jgi:signal transduction histidine kinase